jgi:hypothetical protein
VARGSLDHEDISAAEAWKERLSQLILQAYVVVFVVPPEMSALPRRCANVSIGDQALLVERARMNQITSAERCGDPDEANAGRACGGLVGSEQLH